MSKARAGSWVSLVCVLSLASCAPYGQPEPGMALGTQHSERRVPQGDADMSTGEHVWQVANGRGPRDHPALADLDLGNLGRGLVGGESFPLLTRTLLFTTVDAQGSQPPRMYAYDKSSGDVLWEFELPGGVHANPMTYMYEGRQYLAVSVNGPSGEALVALALGTSR